MKAREAISFIKTIVWGDDVAQAHALVALIETQEKVVVAAKAVSDYKLHYEAITKCKNCAYQMHGGGYIPCPLHNMSKDEWIDMDKNLHQAIAELENLK